MKPSKSTLVIPILLIAFGIGWLLKTWEIAPEIDWTWTLGLAAGGIILLVVLGLDKMTVVCAPLLFVASLLSIFRYLGMLGVGVMVPALIIVTGVLLLIARRPSIPTPGWIADSPKKDGD